MPVHKNSRKAYGEIDTRTITGRIFKVFEATPHPMTDRQMAEHMGYEDMNKVRPKINKLIEDGLCDEVGDIIDGKTLMEVRLVTIHGRLPARPKKVLIPREQLEELHGLMKAWRVESQRTAALWLKIWGVMDAIEAKQNKKRK